MPWNPNRNRIIPGAPKDLNNIIRGGQADISAESRAEQLSPGRHRRPRPLSQCSDGGRLRFHSRMSFQAVTSSRTAVAGNSKSPFMAQPNGSEVSSSRTAGRERKSDLGAPPAFCYCE
jgi:hypothetical protein